MRDYWQLVCMRRTTPKVSDNRYWQSFNCCGQSATTLSSRSSSSSPEDGEFGIQRAGSRLVSGGRSGATCHAQTVLINTAALRRTTIITPVLVWGLPSSSSSSLSARVVQRVGVAALRTTCCGLATNNGNGGSDVPPRNLRFVPPVANGTTALEAANEDGDSQIEHWDPARRLACPTDVLMKVQEVHVH
jgi:hypothetical protein